MIEANELRINNLLYFNGTHKEIGKVTVISNFFSLHYSVNINNRDNITYSLNELQPIPLTEEKLLKCGGVNDMVQYFEGFKMYSLKIDSIYLNLISREHTDYYELNIGYVKIKIKHLHQLQNLIFELTGKELEINL